MLPGRLNNRRSVSLGTKVQCLACAAVDAYAFLAAAADPPVLWISDSTLCVTAGPTAWLVHGMVSGDKSSALQQGLLMQLLTRLCWCAVLAVSAASMRPPDAAA